VTVDSTKTRHVDSSAPVLQSSRKKSRRNSRADHRQQSLKSENLLAPIPKTTTANKKVQRRPSVPEGRNPWTIMVAPLGSGRGESSPRRTSVNFLQSRVRCHCHQFHHEVDLTIETAAKMKLDMQIEAILKPKKGNRTKRKKKDADEELDRYADEEVSRLRESMLAAAADDDQSNKQKLPATAKLKLLPQVLEILRK